MAHIFYYIEHMNTFIKESVESSYSLGGYDNTKEGISKESITTCHSIIYYIIVRRGLHIFPPDNSKNLLGHPTEYTPCSR